MLTKLSFNSPPNSPTKTSLAFKETAYQSPWFWKHGFAIGAGSNANGGGVALNGGDPHPDCNISLGAQCFNMPGR